MKTTNTNNTTTIIINRSDIFRRAWALRREIAAVKGCAVMAVSMSAPLGQAWAEAKGVSAERYHAERVAREWAAMPDGDKVKMMRACVRKAAKTVIGYSTEDHYLQFTEVPAFGCFGLHDFDEFVSETCVRVLANLADIDRLTARNEKRTAQGKLPLSLIALVFNGARASIAAVYYNDGKHSVARDIIVKDDNGHEVSAIETVAEDYTQADKYAAAILRADLDRYAAGLDETGKHILAGLLESKTERQIAEGLTISNVAVHKRIVKMRAALEELRTA